MEPEMSDRVFRGCVWSVVAFAALPAQAQPTNWKLVEESTTSYIFIDVSRLRKAGDRLTAWTLWNAKPETAGLKNTAASPKPILSSIENVSVDCSRIASDTVAVFNYSERLGKGDVISSKTFPPETPFVYPPNSVGEAIIQFACQTHRRSQSAPVATTKKAEPQKSNNPF